MSDEIEQRIEFPEDEKKYQWLPMLLEAYHILDHANKDGIAKEKVKRKKNLACAKGCYYCCLNQSVPITAIELAGISWYASEKLEGESREKVKSQLSIHGETSSCPFLIETVCSIYLVRPIACRSFHVFGEKCDLNEDPWVTRRNETWTHSRDIGYSPHF